MNYTVPPPEHRIVLHHDNLLEGVEHEAQVKEQNDQIVKFAQTIAGLFHIDRYVDLEVWYVSLGRNQVSSEDDFDAVRVDIAEEKIIGTLPPYDEIDPDWRSKR